MIAAGVRRWLAFGSGIGISIEGPRGAESLRVVAVRLRPGGGKVAGELQIEDFYQRPAAEWGAEYAAFVTKLGMQHVAATVLLPRQEVILRQISLPGVSDKDLDAAVAFQLDSLHPYDESDAVGAWARLEGSDMVAVAIARRDRVDSYATLFAEAGVKLAGFTCSGIAVHSALRVLGSKPSAAVLATEPLETGIEIYGESGAKPLFSAAFDLAPEESPERALSLAAAELRIEGEPSVVALNNLLHAPPAAARAYAAALTSAYPRGSSPLNLLPADAREVRSPWQWVPAAALAGAVLLAAIGLAVLPGYRNGQYLNALNDEIAKVQPLATRAAAIDEEVRTTRERTMLLDQIRQQGKADLDVMDAMTALLEPPTWLRSMDIAEDQVRISGETPQAAPLIKVIDESPLFEGSEFQSPPARIRGVESFSIRTKRVGAPVSPQVVAGGKQ